MVCAEQVWGEDRECVGTCDPREKRPQNLRTNCCHDDAIRATSCIGCMRLCLDACPNCAVGGGTSWHGDSWCSVCCLAAAATAEEHYKRLRRHSLRNLQECCQPPEIRINRDPFAERLKTTMVARRRATLVVAAFPGPNPMAVAGKAQVAAEEMAVACSTMPVGMRRWSPLPSCLIVFQKGCSLTGHTNC